MRMERMTAFGGMDSDTPLVVEVERLGAGAGKVRCFECGGTGVSPLPPELFPARACVECKGTGFVWVSV
jgi:DnaJ-class molecular chaperone